MTNQQSSVTKRAHISTHHHPPGELFSVCAREFGFPEQQMVRTANHIEDDETPDSSTPIEVKRVDRKGKAFRSKHSETEQRRRSKINERFQILRDLIPANDQKRDKASFLLEVIEHIQFLQDRVQTYEGSFHGWSPEPPKLTPRRVSSEQFEGFMDQSQLESHLSSLEDNIVLNPTLLSEVQNPVALDLTGAPLYTPTINHPTATNPCLPLNMQTQPHLFDTVSGQPYKGSVPDTEQLTHQSQSHSERSYTNNCSVHLYRASEQELKSANGKASISSAYSQGLLNSLTDALQSSGVDLSQANISVQLDIGKRPHVGTAETMFNLKDHQNPTGLHSWTSGDFSDNYEHLHKRFRSEQS